MPSTSVSPVERLRVIEGAFRDQIPGRVALLRSTWEDLRSDPTSRSHHLARLEHEVRRLAGSVGVFGFERLSECLSVLAARIGRALGPAEGLSEPERVAIERDLRAVEAVVLVGDLACGEPGEARHDPSPDVLLVEHDAELAGLIALELRAAGFSVRVLDHPARIPTVLDHSRPSAIVLDVCYPGQPSGGLAAVARIRERTEDLPIVLLSSRTDAGTRLEAVRREVQVFMARPVDIEALVDQLRVLTTAEVEGPLRALVVDDDPFLVMRHALLLEGAGFVTEGATDALLAHEGIAAFRPDVLLVDHNMPGANGAELAALVRQNPDTANLPIVFLSAEDRPAVRLEAMARGGDAFLDKGVDDGALVELVRTRARRHRFLEASIRRRAGRVEPVASNRRQWTRQMVDVARQQQRLLPEMPALPGYGLASHYEPCEEVGGDLYDAIELPDGRLGIAIGDVCGHGLLAGFLMAMTAKILRQIAPRSASPRDVLIEVEQAIRPELDRGMFVTLLFGILDPVRHTLCLARAGHVAPLRNHPSRRPIVGPVESAGAAIGIGSSRSFARGLEEVTLDLLPGDRLLLASDGLFEMSDPAGEEFGLRRVERLLCDRAHRDPVRLVRAIVGEVDRFRDGTPPRDDLTILAVCRSDRS